MKKFLTILLVACLSCSIAAEDTLAGKGSSSRPSSSKPSSSKPPASRSSKPSSSSKPPSSKPPASSSSGTKPRFGSGSSKPVTPKVTPPTNTPKPKFGSGSSKPKQGSNDSPATDTPKPRFGGSGSNSSTKPDANNSRPDTSFSSKADANRREASRRRYQESTKAVQPPKEEYVASNGKSVKINADSATSKRIREKPSSYHAPEQRRNRIETHVTHHHYSHPYSWYGQQPYMHVGCGYSSAFFWMMMIDWNAERRANWLYHNRDQIEQDAYNKGVQDAKVAALIAEMEAKKIARDNNYVDPEFAENPSDMYDQEYVEAVYNPTIIAPPESNIDGWAVLKVMMWIVIVGGVIVGIVLLVTKVRFGE